MEATMQQTDDSFVLTTKALCTLAEVCLAAGVTLEEQVCEAVWSRAMDLAQHYELDELIGTLEDNYNDIHSYWDRQRIEQFIGVSLESKLA